MAIAAILDFDGATLDQYDEVIKKMGFTPGGKGAPGGLSHWVIKTDDGIRVTDLWKSQAEFDEFAQNHIGPLAAEVGLPNPPKVTIHEVHNHLTAG